MLSVNINSSHLQPFCELSIFHGYLEIVILQINLQFYDKNISGFGEMFIVKFNLMNEAKSGVRT